MQLWGAGSAASVGLLSSYLNLCLKPQSRSHQEEKKEVESGRARTDCYPEIYGGAHKVDEDLYQFSLPLTLTVYSCSEEMRTLSQGSKHTNGLEAR